MYYILLMNSIIPFLLLFVNCQNNTTVSGNLKTVINQQGQLNECQSSSQNVIKEEVTTQGVKNELFWFIDWPRLPLLFMKSPTLPEGECKQQTQKYLEELRNQTLWAVEMYDSSTKHPEGILMGKISHYGNFDECYDGGNNEIGTRYCLIDFKYERKDLVSVYRDFYTKLDQNGSFWEKTKKIKDRLYFPRHMIRTSLCVPSKCNADDVEKALAKPLEAMAAEHNMILTTSVNPLYCQSRDDAPEISSFTIIFCLITLGCCTIVGFSTWYDGNLIKDRNELSTMENILLCFSLYKNAKNFFEVKYGNPALDSIHGIRIMYLVYVSLAHATIRGLEIATMNIHEMERLTHKPLYLLVFNRIAIIDVMFTIGGLLTMYNWLRDIEKKKKNLHLGNVIIKKFLRLTPSYMFIISFYSFLLPYIGTGPLWRWKVESESNICVSKWWFHFFFLDNYVQANDTVSKSNTANEHIELILIYKICMCMYIMFKCMLQSWYLPVDFQMHIIAFFVLRVFLRLPRKTGYSFLGLLITTSCAINIIVAYINNADSVFTGYLIPGRFVDNPYFSDYYIKTHMRASPYFLGMLLGAILHDYNSSTWRMPKIWSRILFLLLLGLSQITLLYGYKFIFPNTTYTSIENALYSGLHRLIFASCYGFTLILFTVSDGLDSVLTLRFNPWIQKAAKLNFAWYLTHQIRQIYHTGSARSAIKSGIWSLIDDGIQDMFFTLAFSFFIHFVIEMPYRNLEKRFFESGDTTKKTN